MSLIDELKTESGLDQRDQYFLDILFDEFEGDFSSAMTKAGYPKTVPVGELRRRLSKEIKKASKEYLVSQTPRAAIQLSKIFLNPNAMGTKNIISAAKEILDRGDVNKEDTVSTETHEYIVILPPKND